MAVDYLLQRLEAYQLGRPLPIGEYLQTCSVPSEATFFVTFVRMGGESTPWGVAYRQGNAKPKVFWAPDPRKRTELSRALAEFSKAFCADWSSAAKKLGKKAHPQLWVPNQSHLDIFHSLALRYLFTRFEIEEDTKEQNQERITALQALGRLSNYIFMTSQLPGQTQIVSASSALKSAYCFPADDLRQAHLGFLLAWLKTSGDRAKRARAAAVAEGTPISVSIDPRIERAELLKPVDSYSDGSLQEATRKMAVQSIGQVIERELLVRMATLESAFDCLKKDGREPNPGLAKLAEKTSELFQREFVEIEEKVAKGEKVWIPNPDTDLEPAQAARRYFSRDEMQTLADSELLKYDGEIQRGAIAEGSALEGRLVRISKTKVGKGVRIEWALETSDEFPLRIREGDALYLSDLEDSELVVETITSDLKTQKRTFVLSVEKPKTTKGGFDMADSNLKKREQILLLPKPFVGILFRKLASIFNKEKPGQWVFEKLANRARNERKAS
jgi:hypothetical protein